MMKFQGDPILFTMDNVMVKVKTSSRSELLRLLAEKAVKLPLSTEAELDSEEIFQGLWQKQQQLGDFPGEIVAFPHLRIPQINHLGIIIGSLAEPLKPLMANEHEFSVFCMLLIPESMPEIGLKFFAKLASFLRVKENLNRLLNVTQPGEMLNILREIGSSEMTVLFAGDLMIPPKATVEIGMPLKDATSLMAQQDLLTVAVLDEEGKFCGQLSSLDLFKLGIPDFFSQLRSVGFIRYFDPFEKYFNIEANSKVKDVMDRDACVFTADATIIEIVFELSVKKVPLIFVVDDQRRLLGVIDSSLLIERVINL